MNRDIYDMIVLGCVFVAIFAATIFILAGSRLPSPNPNPYETPAVLHSIAEGVGATLLIIGFIGAIALVFLIFGHKKKKPENKIVSRKSKKTRK